MNNKLTTLDFDSGALIRDGSIIAASNIDINSSIKSLQYSTFKTYHSNDSRSSIYNIDCEFLGLQFSVGVGFENGKCVDVIFRWKDGSSEKLGYEASYEDLYNEKKLLSIALTDFFSRKADFRGATTFKWHFPWGSVHVSYETKSNNCAIYINYVIP